jgi:hypothetical protein
MTHSNFAATLETVGDWNGREESAVARWNAHVLPTIQTALDSAAKGKNYEEDMEKIKRGADAAWEAFCTAGGSRAAVRAFKRTI